MGHLPLRMLYFRHDEGLFPSFPFFPLPREGLLPLRFLFNPTKGLLPFVPISLPVPLVN